MHFADLPRAAVRPCVMLCLLGASLCLLPDARAQTTYIAVGDSLAFGFKSLTPQSPNYTPVGGAGFTGYAGLYQQNLEAQTGAPVNLVNLGIVGETTTSYFATGLGSGTPNGVLNSNYASASPSQADLLDTLLTGPGRDVGVVTIQVGANDVLQAVETGQNPAAALATVQANYNTLLSRIQTDEGGKALSNITIVGYYDPYANLSPANPYAALRVLSPGLTASLNSILLGEASQFGARFVDLSAPFATHIADYDNYVLANSAQDSLPSPTGTGPPVPNDHPTDLGYALIAQQLAAPEPSSWLTLSAGMLCLTLLLVRARRARLN